MGIAESDYEQWDAVEMARLVGKGEVTAAELAETARARMAAAAPLNAVAEMAGDVDERGAGPLGGVPYAVKELLAWPGLHWTMGSRLLAGNGAAGFSPYAARLRQAGLHVLCSTTSSEFGLLGSTETALHGVTVNPWRAGLSAGGSSGGSAVLVAAGVVPVAHGSAAGGSLRVPAALNGVFGFKPSNRRSAPTGPEMPGLPALVVEHCMSRTVRDSATVLAATERVGSDATHAPVGLVTHPDPPRLRVALVLTSLTGWAPDAAAEREVLRAARICESLGHAVEVAEPPEIDGYAVSRAFFTAAAITMTQMAEAVGPMLGRAPGPDELEPFTLELIDWARTLSPDAGVESERVVAAARAAYLRLFDSFEVVLTPTLARTSWPVGHLAPSAGRETLIARTEEAVCYTPIANVADCPAMSVPLGADDGLPVAVHVAARPGADRVLLSLAYELEAAAPWRDGRPTPWWLDRAA